MKFKMLVGDWSGDGHGESETFIVETNASSIKDVEVAYDKATDLTGVHPIQSICSEYEDPLITKKDIDKLKAHNINVADYAEEVYNKEDREEGNLSFQCRADAWVEFILAFIKLGNPLLECKVVDDEFPTFDAGGYGILGD